MSTKTLISVAEFDRLIEPDDLRYELDEGELIEMTRPRVGHNRVVMKMTQAAGARVVWLVHPELREVEVWDSASGPVRVVGDGDTLESRDLLPGFSYRVSDLF